MPPKHIQHEEPDFPLVEELKQVIFDALSEYQQNEKWIDCIKSLAIEVRKHTRWQKIIIALLEVFGFDIEHTWRNRLDTLMATCVHQSYDIDELLDLVKNKAPEPDETFIAAFTSHLTIADAATTPAVESFVKPCPKCQTSNVKKAQFCMKCGSAMSNASPAEHTITAAPQQEVNGALQAIAHHLTEQTKFLQALANGTAHEDEYYDALEPEARPTGIWNEKVLTQQEICQVREQHGYPMATYCQRAMVLVVDAFERIYPQADKETLLLLSKAVRDMQMEFVLPGSKPQQAERFALATSLIGHRIPKEELKKAMSRPKWQPATTKQEAPAKLPNPHPNPKSAKPGKHGQAQSQQTDP